jgi:acyl-CoA thioester hydrolase
MKNKIRNYKHITPIQVRFNDIDIMGHVNNSVHQNYYDIARVEYFKTVLSEDLDWQGLTVVLASIHIDFFSPVHLDEKTAVRSCVEMIGEKSLTMTQELFNTETGEIKSFNRAVLVGFSRQDNSTMVLPDKWKTDIINFEGKISQKYPITSN